MVARLLLFERPRVSLPAGIRAALLQNLTVLKCFSPSKPDTIADMRWVLLLLATLHSMPGCELVAPPVNGALRRADIVFSGSITEIRESQIVFQVERVWKGNPPRILVMPKITWGETPCMPGFYNGWVKVGATFLVYATKRLPGMNYNGYVAAAGSRTAPLENATDDLKKLGHGHPPKQR